MSALEAFTAHLNLGDGDADEADLTLKLDAAIAYTGNLVASVEPLSWDAAPADVQQAILMLAAHWFENREAAITGISVTRMPLGYFDLLAPYRVWAF